MEVRWTDSPNHHETMSSSGRNRPRKPDEVYDEQGRQRFHGAFTGGFSAGYFNTVGSKEGWTPRAGFVSRRGDAAQQSNQNQSRVPTQSIHDFMDEEDAFDTRISSRYVGMAGSSGGSARDKMVQLMQVDDRIGWKLLRMASVSRHKTRSLEAEKYLEEDPLPDSISVNIPLESNLNCRGLGYVPDETLRLAKEAKLQSFYQPDDEYDIYDGGVNAKLSLSNNYEREVIDGRHFPYDENDEQENDQNSFAAGLDAFTSVGRDSKRSDIIPGFHLGSEEQALITRYPGPDVPIDFVVLDKEFPIELDEAEKQLERGQQHVHERKIAQLKPTLSEKSVAISPQVQFAKVAAEMRNRFTSASGGSQEKVLTKTPFVVKREVFRFIPNRLLCKRFNVSPIESSGIPSTDVSSTRSALDEALSQVTSTRSLKPDESKDGIEEEPIQRPPIDLFKSIFSPDSETSSDESDVDEGGIFQRKNSNDITPSLDKTIMEEVRHCNNDQPLVNKRRSDDSSYSSSDLLHSRHRKKKRSKSRKDDRRRKSSKRKSSDKDRKQSKRDREYRKKSTSRKN